MKRGGFAYAISLILTLCLASYLGFWCIDRIQHRLTTALASPASVEQSISARGIIIRQEQMLSLPEDISPLLTAGTRLGAGDALPLSSGAEICAPVSGYIAPADGFEKLGPGILSVLDADALRVILDSSPSGGGWKMISGTSWYYAALIPSAAGEALKVGQRLSLCGLEGLVVSLGPENGGERLIIIRFETGMADTLGQRLLTADISLSRISALRVPRAAVFSDDSGQYFVRTLTAGLEEEDKPVSVLHSESDWLLVSGEDGPGTLKSGDTVILFPESPQDEEDAD